MTTLKQLVTITMLSLSLAASELSVIVPVASVHNTKKSVLGGGYNSTNLGLGVRWGSEGKVSHNLTVMALNDSHSHPFGFATVGLEYKASELLHFGLNVGAGYKSIPQRFKVLYETPVYYHTWEYEAVPVGGLEISLHHHGYFATVSHSPDVRYGGHHSVGVTLFAIGKSF